MSTAAAPVERAGAIAGLARWRVLIGAVLVQLILGTVYGYSIFWTPLENQVYPRVVIAAAPTAAATAAAAVENIVADKETEKKIHAEQTGKLKYAFAICILAFALVMVFAGRVQDVRGPVITAIIGAVLLGVGFLLGGLVLRGSAPTPEAVQTKLLLVWLTIGLLAGAGIGFAYVCPIASLVKWFPDKKGLVSGVAVAGFGFGAYFFSNPQLSFSAAAFIDPKQGNNPISTLFMVHGLVALVVVTLGALMLSNPPGTPPKAAQESDWRDLLRRPAFYMLWPMFFSGALAGLTVIVIMKDFAGEQLIAAAGAASNEVLKAELLKKGAEAVGMLAVFNAIGRIVWGVVSDKIGRTGAFVAMFALQAVMMFLLPMMTTGAAISVAACLVGFNFGGNFALFPSATADLFGAKNMGANYGLVFTSYGIAGVVGTYTGNLAKSATGAFDAAFYVAGILCLLSAALAIALHRSHQQQTARVQ